MPTKTNKRKKAPVKSSVRQGGHKKANLRNQSKPMQILIVLVIITVALVVGMFVYSRMQTADLKAKANRWTTVPQIGANSGMKIVACKKPASAGKYSVIVVASKEKSLQLTKRDASGNPLSTNLPNPQVYVGGYAMQSYATSKKAYEYVWSGSVDTPTKQGNVWWNNEVTAIAADKLPKGRVMAANEKLLVFGMSNQANAPTFTQSGSGIIIPRGGFTGFPPAAEDYPNKPLDYNKARTAWEKQVPSVQSLVNCQ